LGEKDASVKRKFRKFKSYSGVRSSSLFWLQVSREEKTPANAATIEEATNSIVQWARQYRERMTSNG
jgi:hypothetical protein